MREMMASLQAADDVSQSSKGGAEEGEEEQVDNSDGEPAGQLPAYKQGNPRELQSDGHHRTNAAQGAEGKAAQGQDVNAAQE